MISGKAAWGTHICVPHGWIKTIFFMPVFGCRCENISRSNPETTTQFPVVIERWQYPFPSRTRKSSTSSPMVLYGSLYGRVGRCRDILCYTNQQKPPLETGEAFLFSISSSLDGRAGLGGCNARSNLPHILAILGGD